MTNSITNMTRRETIALAAGTLVVSAGLSSEVRASAAAEGGLTLGRDQPFELGWRFFKGAGDGFETAAFDDSSWRLLDLPHDWSIEDLHDPAPPRRVGPFDASAEGGTATGFTLGGEGWYRKRFHVGDLPTGARAEILFDGVYTLADVWLNGQALGDHVHGYSPFSFDATPHLQRNSDNVLAVRVRNIGNNSRWYSGSGIYRSVRIDVFAEPARIARWGVAAWTRRIRNDRAEIDVKTTLAELSAGLHLRTRLRAGDGSIAAETVSRARDSVEQTLRLNAPKLWSPSSPELYVLETEVLRGETVVDRLTQPFGVRVITFDAEHGMRINGETVKLRGGCIHHDNGLLGAAAFADADERRVLRLKARGFNAIRSSHYPCSRSFRAACDRHGMLLIEEAFDMWHVGKNHDDYAQYFAERWRSDLSAMVLSARNSPSVIMWSIGNEIPQRASREGIEYAWRLTNEVHALDPTRPVTAAIHGFNGRPVIADTQTAPRGRAGAPDGASVIFLDVPGYNYRLADFEPDHTAHPSRVAYASETYARDAYDYAELMARAPYVLGEFVWTSMDYLGEAGIGGSARMRAPQNPTTSRAPPMMPAAYPWVVANCGDIDLIGDQKPQSLFRDVVWGKSALEITVQRPLPAGQMEYVSLWGWPDELSSWTWPAAESSSMSVRVYTSGDRVDLTLNGALIESKSASVADKMRLEFAVPYTPGVLEAVAYRNGAEIARKTLNTATAPKTLRLTAENVSVRADRQGLVFVALDVLDVQARLLPDAKLPVRVNVSGPAELIAFGSGDPHAVGSFQAPHAQTFRGRALAIVRLTGDVGIVRIEAQSQGLESAATSIEVT